MKLKSEDTHNLLRLINTCAVGGIDSLIIEDGVARGINEARSFVIISSTALPGFPQKIGLGRLSALKQRLELIAGADIEAVESERGEIGSLNISLGRNKAQFRCTATMLIKAPKSINDELQFSIYPTEGELQLLLNSIKVMGSKSVQLTIKKDRTVQFVTTDANNDQFTSVIEQPAGLVGEEAGTVTHYYHADVFYSTVKSIDAGAEAAELVVGESGTLRFNINGHNVVLLPKVNEDGDDE